MKILFDHQIFVYQNFGGISRYIVELARHLPSIKKTEVVFSAPFSENAYLRTFFPNASRSLFQGKFLGRMTAYNFMSRFLSKRKLAAEDFTLFHPTYYDDYYLGQTKQPFVVTVHDMIHELYPGLWPNQAETIAQKKRVIHASAGIIAVSQNTKDDLLSIYPTIPANKVRVIHHGNSFSTSNSEERLFPEKYMLYVGLRDHYKNFIQLLNATKEVVEEHPKMLLVCAGGGNFTQEEKTLVQSLGLETRTINISIESDEHLATLYKHAEAFVYPSLYEGFGIPILEAFAAGCPVALSRASCFPEVAEDAAIYFDGNNPSDMAKVLSELLKNQTLRNELKQKGAQRLQFFSWEKAAQETFNFYQEVTAHAGK